MYGYGTGMSAVIAKHFVARPASAVQVARRMPAGVRKLLAPDSAKNDRRTRDYPGSLVRQELAGYLTVRCSTSSAAVRLVPEACTIPRPRAADAGHGRGHGPAPGSVR